MEAVAGLEKQEPKRKIPEALLYEKMDGKSYYRKGYRSVLNKTKSLDDILGSSTLQSVIVFYLQKLLFHHFDETGFWVLTNEAGLHLSRRDNLAGDLFVFDIKTLPPDKIGKNYATVPPLFAFEIDIKADLEKESDLRYIYRKTQKLLDFGVKKVFWITTEAQKVMIAEAGNPSMITVDWSYDVEVEPGLIFNIGAYLKKKGIKVE